MFFVTCTEPGVSGTWSRNAYIYGYENVLPLFSLYLAGLWLLRPRKVTISGRGRGGRQTPHMGTTMVTIVAALSNLTISSLPILFVNLLVLYMLPILILDLEPVDLVVAHTRLR